MFSILDNIIADKGYYINLDKSKDRKSKVEEQIKKYNIKNLFRFKALTDEHLPFSCTKSHLGVFKEALNSNLDTIFVAEDDFFIEEFCYQPNLPFKKISFQQSLKKVINDLKNLKWDIILLGCNPKSHLIPLTNNLAEVHNSTGAWAYLINKKAYKYILENLNYMQDRLAIDDYLPYLNKKGFNCLTTIPMLINHAEGLVSTLQPSTPVYYNNWIRGNYNKFLYDTYSKNNFMEKDIIKNLTIVIAGHFTQNYLFYLRYLLYSFPSELKKCKIIINYDYSNDKELNNNKYLISSFFRDIKEASDLNVDINYSYGGLISTIDNVINKINTKYFLFLEHDWVFLDKKSINFKDLLIAFENYNFINAVWFNKDDNQLRGFEIETDVNGDSTPFQKEDRVKEINLVTTCRWSNNPAIFRTSKFKEWFYTLIINEHIGKTNQGPHNVEETIIPIYRNEIKNSKWIDIRDNWGTFLYGDINEGPYVGHTDASKRYQGANKSQPEINGENYIKNNPLN